MDDNTKPVATLADDVEEFEGKQKDFQGMYGAGGPFKERVDAVVREWHKPVTEMEEIPTSPEVGKEVEGYVERIEKEAELAKPVVDDYTQQVLVAPTAPQKPKVTLPLTDDQIQTGLHHKVYDAIRWLAEWCVRQIKVIRSHS